MTTLVESVLFSRNARTEIRGAPQEIPLDAVISRFHNFRSAVTRAPIEDGSTINDHVILEPESFSMEGLVSDHPVDLLESLSSVVGAVGSVFGFGGESETRSITAAKALEEAWRQKALLTIVTRLKTYDDMVIESLSWGESQGLAEALSFTLTVTKIRKVSLTTTALGQLSAAAGDLAAGPVERGRQRPRAAPASGTSASPSPGFKSLREVLAAR